MYPITEGQIKKIKEYKNLIKKKSQKNLKKARGVVL